MKNTSNKSYKCGTEIQAVSDECSRNNPATSRPGQASPTTPNNATGHICDTSRSSCSSCSLLLSRLFTSASCPLVVFINSFNRIKSRDRLRLTSSAPKNQIFSSNGHEVMCRQTSMCRAISLTRQGKLSTFPTLPLDISFEVRFRLSWLRLPHNGCSDIRTSSSHYAG